MDQTTSIDPRLFGASPALRGTEPPARTDAAKVREVAMQFESMLLEQMLKELQPAMSGEEDDDKDNGFSFNLGPLSDVMSTQLSLMLSRAGGMGLADSLARALDRQTTPQSAQSTAISDLLSQPALPEGFAMPTSGGTQPGIEPAIAPSATPIFAPLVMPTTMPIPTPTMSAVRISSAFGLRTDPINGQSRFHHGTDVAMVKGHEVRAAADGTVTAVSQRSGYGLTVVVAHENGVETRYAHLSAADVRPGDEVSRGGVIARAGNSGRSTGPHLHFEVREGGQSVDPRGWLDAVVAAPGNQ
jgi:Rod binding domain-containing protein